MMSNILKKMSQRDPSEFLDNMSDYLLIEYASGFFKMHSQLCNHFPKVLIKMHATAQKENAKPENIDKQVVFKESIWIKTLTIAKLCVEAKADYSNTDALAYLLNRFGMIDKAKEMAEKSVKLAPEDKKKDLWAYKFINEEADS
jgi:hypothetical protein